MGGGVVPSEGAAPRCRPRDLPGVRAMLAARNTPYAEAPLPGFPLHQLFLTDPFGLRVELTVDMKDPVNGAA